jgi:hypothetical protein
VQVTFTNTTAGDIYLSAIYMTVAALSSVTTHRTRSQLDAEQQLKAYVQAGEITLSFVMETGDLAGLGSSAPPLTSYTNALRPAANLVPAFTAIWNSDDAAENWTDGVAWRDNNGVLT